VSFTSSINALTSGPSSDVTTPRPLSFSPPNTYDSCADYTTAVLYTQPAADFQAIREPILISMAALAVTAFMGFNFFARFAKPATFERISQKLADMDSFSSAHAVARGDVLKNSPNARGGIATIALVVCAVGLSASVLVQLGTKKYTVTQSLVDTPSQGSTSSYVGVHQGTLQLQLVLAGGYSADSCNAAAIQLSSTIATAQWRLISAAGTPLHDGRVTDILGFQPTGIDAQDTACYVTALCEDCTLTQLHALSLQVAWTYQSVAVSLSAQSAYPKCSETVRRTITPSSAAHLMDAINLNIQVRPVAFKYTGTLAGGSLVDGTGHDVSSSGEDVTLKGDVNVLKPDTDKLTLTLTFTPAPYTTLIVVSDAMDAVTVITSISGPCVRSGCWVPRAHEAVGQTHDSSIATSQDTI
jgi:hypothetical protein